MTKKGGMYLSSAKEIVETYKAAIGRGDFTAAWQLLHDDLAFPGPLTPLTAPTIISRPASGWRTLSKPSM
jgi:hypothetical protein